MSEPTPLFAERQPVADADVTPSFVQMARAIASIAATRVLLLIAVLTGAAIWGFTCYDPTRERLLVAVAFSLVFVVPLIGLYWRRA